MLLCFAGTMPRAIPEINYFQQPDTHPHGLARACNTPGPAVKDARQLRQNLQFSPCFSRFCENFVKLDGAGAGTCAAQKGLAAQLFLVYCSIYELIFTAEINLR
ncbi:MAG: hypothetical protein ACK40C_02715 [Novosphingobium meiothermophilum]